MKLSNGDGDIYGPTERAKQPPKRNRELILSGTRRCSNHGRPRAKKEAAPNKRTRNRASSKCGCKMAIAFARDPDGWYEVTSVQLAHTGGCQPSRARRTPAGRPGPPLPTPAPRRQQQRASGWASCTAGRPTSRASRRSGRQPLAAPRSARPRETRSLRGGVVEDGGGGGAVGAAEQEGRAQALGASSPK